MNHSIFEQNIAALHRTNPGLAVTIQNLPLDGLKAELITTKTKVPSLRILSEEQQKPILLHSAYDPVREAKRWVESIDMLSPTNAIILGMGLGYPLLMLIQSLRQNIRNLLIVENDPRILKLAFQLIDLRPLISQKGVQWLVGLTPQQIIDQISNETWTDIILHNCKILSHDPSLQYSPIYYQTVNQLLVETIAHEEVNLRTTFENRGRNQFNLFLNLPGLLNGYLPKSFQNRFKGWPAIVAAAGPSLDTNIHHLKSIQDRAGLIIVDTAQKTFEKIKIPVDAVVTGDPTPLNFSHFEAIDSLHEAFLVFHPEVNRQIIQKFISHPYLLPMYDENSPLLNHLMDQESRCGIIERAMNVGHLAVNFALYLGFDPIILVGFDFAFPRDGGTTHVKDAAVSRTISAVDQDGVVNVGAKEGKAISERGKMLLVPGYYGDKVPTTAPFLQYIRALERTIAETPCQFIDATEGGAAFEGTQQMPLQEAINHYMTKDGIHPLWEQIKQEPRNDFSPQEIIKKLQEGLTILHQSRTTCTTLWRMLEDWKTKFNNPNLTQAEADHLWKQFDQIWVDMVGNEIFDAFLGTSVQHLYFIRQRTTIMEDNKPQTFLKSVSQKYEFILTELAGLIDNFIQTTELAIQNIQSQQ